MESEQLSREDWGYIIHAMLVNGSDLTERVKCLWSWTTCRQPFLRGLRPHLKRIDYGGNARRGAETSLALPGIQRKAEW